MAGYCFYVFTEKECLHVHTCNLFSLLHYTGFVKPWAENVFCHFVEDMIMSNQS